MKTYHIKLLAIPRERNLAISRAYNILKGFGYNSSIAEAVACGKVVEFIDLRIVRTLLFLFEDMGCKLNVTSVEKRIMTREEIA